MLSKTVSLGIQTFRRHVKHKVATQERKKYYLEIKVITFILNFETIMFHNANIKVQV